MLHFGGSDFRCGLRPFIDTAQQAEIERALFSRLEQAVARAGAFARSTGSSSGASTRLRDLFLDERRKAAKLILRDVLKRYESDYLEIFETNRRLLEFLREIDSPIPTELSVAADVALSLKLRQVASALADGQLSLPDAHTSLLELKQTASAWMRAQRRERPAVFRRA